VDLERLFRQVVLNLAAQEPARLRHPLGLGDIRYSIVPYRANRRALQIESSEDYELALVRLCAGEAGLARTEPGEAQAEFAAELAGSNPDLSLLHRHEKATLRLNPDAVAKVLEPKSDLRFAPSQSPIAPPRNTPRKRTRGKTEPGPPATPPSSCNRCGGALPPGRVVNFCPECGQNLTRRRCPECNTELESSWRHCIHCGAGVNA
jgi:hypothetical protein